MNAKRLVLVSETCRDPMDIGEDWAYTPFGESGNKKFKVKHSRSREQARFDFTIIDRKIEEIQTLVEELIQLKESLMANAQPDQFCSYLV